MENKNQDDRELGKYKDLSGLTVQEMNIGLWIAEHRQSLSRLLVIFLIAISAIFFIYSTYSYIIYFMQGKLDNQPENQVVSPRDIISPMTVAPVDIFRNQDSYDLAALIKNPNGNFSASFSYCFQQGDQETACGESFILPGEEKHILALGLKEGQPAGGVSFVVKDIFWSRVNRHLIPDWAAYRDARLNFRIADVKLYSATKSGLSETIDINSLEFTVTNDTPYSYFEVPFDILFYSGSKLVGVNRVVASNLLGGETRRIKFSWPSSMSFSGDLKIEPHIDINNKDVYMKYQAE